jgi:hypothetical protein
MRVLFYVGLLTVGIALAFWLSQRHSDARRRLPPTTQGAGSHSVATIPTPSAGERARLLYGSEAGPGQLQLTSSQLVFTADSGRVWVVERIDISGVSATRELPDRTVARAALVVTASGEVHYFEVDDPLEWINRLR